MFCELFFFSECAKNEFIIQLEELIYGKPLISIRLANNGLDKLQLAEKSRYKNSTELEKVA